MGKGKIEGAINSDEARLDRRTARNWKDVGEFVDRNLSFRTWNVFGGEGARFAESCHLYAK